jgi:hypothetical protein
MIDVFMLVKEGLIEVDADNNSLERVQFCECNPDHFTEIREMIAREDAGFFGQLETVVLFQDDDFTGQYPTLESIELRLEDEGLPDDVAKLDRLQLKRTFLNVKSSFPYDCVNLDFCDYYYPEPPDMLRVNQTVERFLDWQGRQSDDPERVSLREFVLAVTCRYDAGFPREAEVRLAQLIRNNCNRSMQYMEELLNTRGVAQPEEWIEKDREDFFFAGWPKDIASSAKDKGWSMKVLDYVHYQRVGDKGNPYVIVCLVARFSRDGGTIDDIDPALFALDPSNRQLISEIDRNSEEGQELVGDLESIVVVRNEQAQRKHRPSLPPP